MIGSVANNAEIKKTMTPIPAPSPSVSLETAAVPKNIKSRRMTVPRIRAAKEIADRTRMMVKPVVENAVPLSFFAFV